MKQIQLFEHSDHDAVFRICSTRRGGGVGGWKEGAQKIALSVDPLLPSLPFFNLEHFGEHIYYGQVRAF